MARVLARLTSVAAVCSLLALGVGPASAQDAAPPGRPFILPFLDPPGPDTWLLGQTYGNTVGAYFNRKTTYQFSQGIHFGIDLSAPCGTEVVAVADGVVALVDARGTARCRITSSSTTRNSVTPRCTVTSCVNRTWSPASRSRRDRLSH